jgi:hypothetical protein
MPNRMRVVLNVHGGQQGVADTMEGLVKRNMRSIRAGKVGRCPDKPNTNDGIWRDAVTAQSEGKWTAGTLACWKAAERRVEGDVGACFGFEGARPVWISGQGVAVGFAGRERVKGLGHEKGRSNEFMVLGIDDNCAYAVRDVNNAIAHLNARRIKSQGLPRLYESGVRYKTEGSPELWWDAEEILSHGHDDCEGLAAYRAGELINAGHDASVYTRLIKGPAESMGGAPKGRLFHAVTQVRQPDGSLVYEDPSAILGMKVPPYYQDYSRKQRAKGLPL